MPKLVYMPLHRPAVLALLCLSLSACGSSDSVADYPDQDYRQALYASLFPIMGQMLSPFFQGPDEDWNCVNDGGGLAVSPVADSSYALGRHFGMSNCAPAAWYGGSSSVRADGEMMVEANEDESRRYHFGATVNPQAGKPTALGELKISYLDSAESQSEFTRYLRGSLTVDSDAIQYYDFDYRLVSPTGEFARSYAMAREARVSAIDDEPAEEVSVAGLMHLSSYGPFACFTPLSYSFLTDTPVVLSSTGPLVMHAGVIGLQSSAPEEPVFVIRFEDNVATIVSDRGARSYPADLQDFCPAGSQANR